MIDLAQVVLNGDGLRPEAIRQGVQAGAGAVLATLRPGAVASLVELRRSLGFAVYPVIPNAAAYTRDLADLGMVGAALKRMKGLGPGGWLEVATYGVRNLAGIAKQDFGAMLGVMVQLELPAFARLKPEVVFLHAQMTDLLLACGNGGALRSFCELVQRAGAQPGLQTRNFGHLAQRLVGWRLGAAVVLAPFNPLGNGMHPSREECEAALRGRDLALVAEDVRAGGAVSAVEAARYAGQHGLRAVVLDAEAIGEWGAE
jgi:hypothetical protein